ncbi:MAG TPA: NAD-dependent epimerase/dehydratase family protein [Thermomicrobiaceae bacterium]|nr:NAD-dependent epimerase/dehydratase family protein [Thermomicrobiaceae bacterium]
MKVLVTGATGYIGRVLTRKLLNQGHQVTALVHREPLDALAPRGLQACQADVRDLGAVHKALRGIEAVCHLAGIADTNARRTFEGGYASVNLGGTLNLLRALAQYADSTGRAAAFIHASTGSVYGQASVTPTPEYAITAPDSPYAASKLEAEAAIRSFSEAGAVAGISLRIFNVAGAEEGQGDRNTSRILPRALEVAAARQATLPVYGTGSVVRDFVHVADVADAYARAIGAATAGQFSVFNVGATRASIADVVCTVEKVTGRQVPTRPTFAEPAVAQMHADTSSIRTALGWRPMRSSLEQIVSDAWSVVTAPTTTS